MRIMFLDTETTDITPGQICQLSYILMEDGYVKAKNFFFSVDKVEPGAEKVHGFSKENLEYLSNGKRFNNITTEFMVDLDMDTTLVCHNVAFDYKFLKAELQKCGIFLSRKTFCTMEYFTDIIKIPSPYRLGEYKWPRLSELLEFLEIKPNDVLEGAKNIFGASDISFHDARFDTTGLMMAYNKANELDFFERIR